MANEDRVGDELQEAMLAHELLHSLTAIASSVNAARHLIDHEGRLTKEDLIDLRELVRVIDREVQGQIFAVLNLLSQRAPALVGGLIRPVFCDLAMGEYLQEMVEPYRERALSRGIDIEWTVSLSTGFLCSRSRRIPSDAAFTTF
jgi:hypothetical protein